ENTRIAAQMVLGGSLSLLKFPNRREDATMVAQECLDRVRLSHHMTTSAGDLSPGDKRTSNIAVLFATNSSVVLLDEPMAGVGSGDVPGLTDIIRRLHRESGATVLLVEHHMDVLMGLVEKVAVMHHGNIIAFDTPQQIMENPIVQ